MYAFSPPCHASAINNPYKLISPLLPYEHQFPMYAYACPGASDLLGNSLPGDVLTPVSAGEALHSCSSSSPTSVGSCCNCNQKPVELMQRSASSHSLLKNIGRPSHFVWTHNDAGPVRRVCSTGDLPQQGIIRMVQLQHSRRSESPLSGESNAIIEGMAKACRYSPEEKKQRIERYRSKRSLRNFNKKIKYACRKTLADSRPRIRGRFARNEEIEKNFPQEGWRRCISGEEDEEDDDNWVNFLDSFSTNQIR